MILVLLGSPGAGKGTQAEMLRDRNGFIHINVGEMFRNIMSKTGDLAEQIRPIVKSGNLVSDELTLKLVRQELIHFTASCNLILDGFPRNVVQADGLVKIFEAMGVTDYRVALVEAPRDVIIKRLKSRGRADDTDDVITTRLGIFDSQTAPVVDYFAVLNRLYYINSDGDKENTFEQVLKVIK